VNSKKQVALLELQELYPPVSNFFRELFFADTAAGHRERRLSRFFLQKRLYAFRHCRIGVNPHQRKFIAD
jgi:hypothetical protein